MKITERYDWQLTVWSDMQDHLPRLLALGREVRSITEFGLRDGVATTAFLAAGPESWTGYDINPLCGCSALLREFADGPTALNLCLGPVAGNTLLIPPIAETDLLMIDSYHSSQQVFAELSRHSRQVATWIVLHDTGHPFGMTDEDGTPGGILAGVKHWRETSDGQNWGLSEMSELSFGLQIWRRITPAARD